MASYVLKLFLLLTLCVTMADALDVSVDEEALLAFKSHYITSDPQNALAAWNTTAPMCTWLGISCTRNRTRVQSLNLGGLSLTGSIPPHLSNLSSLRTLNLSNNFFYGRIPEQLGRLSLLQFLDISTNYINGSIPSSFSRCLNLEEIILDNNQLSGNLPSELSLLTNLKILSSFGNNFAGSIPPSIGNFSSLEYLDLGENGFSGTIPEEVGRLSSLRYLYIIRNSIDGVIPLGISRCLGLEEIILEYNQLTGKLPPDLSLLPQLKIFSVYGNNLTGPIPSSFGNFSSLTHLNLGRNSFSGGIPKEMGRLHLLDLRLPENQFTGEIPSSVYNMSSLEVFSVTQNMLVGMLPWDLGLTLPNLQQLYMSLNNFNGLIPRSLSNITGIQNLYLSANHFRGSVPLLGKMANLVNLNLAQNNLSSTTDTNLQWFDSLTNCTHLRILSIASNCLAGQLPSSTANLSTHLQEFCFDDNLLSGNFPQGIENYRNLTVLALHQNSFNGTVPHSIGLLSNVQRFSLNQNMFSGKIPDSFENLTQMYQIFLGDNKFSGNIPRSLGNCKDLRTLDLSGNELSGSIPKEIFGLPELSDRLLLDRNSLTGSLPLEVGNLKNLMLIDVSDNKLSGNIPGSLGDCSNLQNLSMARNGLQGPIPESLRKLIVLENLDLSSNNLSGEIPRDLGKLRSLQNLNLSFNDLHGQVPSEGIFMNISSEDLQGNNKLCSDREVTWKLRLPICADNKSSKSRKNRFLAVKIIVPIVSFAVILGAVICLISAVNSHKKRKFKISSLSDTVKWQHKKISYAEILCVTNGFASQNLIGKGGFGSVYSGNIGAQSGLPDENGMSNVVAIKVLDLQQSKASKSFEAECEALRNVRHRNLVKIITSCSSIDHKGSEFKAIVSDFMPNGSLDKWLFPKSVSGPRLSFIQKLNIAIDIASAMDYLHHDCDPAVVHCDLKPGNVLLDGEMIAHVGDFGLARFLLQDPSKNQCSTIGLKGSIGYIAPEYGLGGQVSTSGDVYSYGILLLEIFTGKKPTDDMFKDGLNLKKFATAVYENQVMGISYSRMLEMSDDSSSISTSMDSSSSSSNGSRSDLQSKREECWAAAITVALSCAAESAKARPNMRETLKKMIEMKESLSQLGGN